MITASRTKQLISLQGVRKSYLQPNGQEICILENIDLELHQGEIVALLGPSGSGKSTLMRMIAGLIPPTQGDILYQDQRLIGLNPGVAIVFQTFALYPWLTVLENVELGLKAKGIAPDLRRQKATQMIDIIGLDGFENAYPKELSGGMRQRVGFARALSVDPELLCMDEPFSALDVLTAENLRTELLDLWLERRIPTQAILIVTHGIEEAVTLADRIIVLGRNPGRIRADFPVTLEHYRDRKSAEFQALVDQVYTIMTNPTINYPAPPVLPTRSSSSPTDVRSSASEPYHRLPAVRIGSVAGLLELFEDRQDHDIYRLEQALKLDADDILPIVDAAKLMDFIELQEGDLHLKPIAFEFIQGTIDQRKQIVRKQLLAHVRLIQKIYNLVQSKHNHRIPKELVLDILENHVSSEEAQHQLNTAIEWGRYAELYGYDEPTGELFLDETLIQIE